MLWKFCTQYASKSGKSSSGWKRSVFSSIPKKGIDKECPNYCSIALMSHASKIILKVLQASLLLNVNREISDVQAGFRKGRGTRDQIANIHWIIEKATEFQKSIYFCFIDYTKAFDCVDHSKLWRILRDGNIRLPDLPPEKSVCRSKATVRTGHGTTDWFQIGKGGCQGYISSPCLFNLYAVYMTQNARLDEAQAGIKITRRNINRQMTPALWQKVKKN